MAIYKILIIIHHYLLNNTATAGGVYMTSGDYLDKILDRMTSTHNITRNFTADGRTFAAYALYEASSEKYVLSRKANLWKVSEIPAQIPRQIPAQVPAQIPALIPRHFSRRPGA